MNSYIEYKKSNRLRNHKFKNASAFSHILRALRASTMEKVKAGIYDIEQFLKIKSGFNALFLLFILILLFITILHI